MHVHASFCTITVTWLKEGALCDQDLRFREFISHKEFAWRGVTGVCHKWNVDLARDFRALRAKFTQFLLRKIAKLLAQFAAALKDGVANTGHSVLGCDRLEEDVVLDFER
jgi:hypothetical protein